MSLIAFLISLSSFDSNACSKTFSSFTRKGLYFTTISADGNVNSYVAVSNIGNAIIFTPCYYPKGGNNLPPVTLPIGRFLLVVCNTSLPALLISGGSLLNIPPNNPKSVLAFIVGLLPTASPIVALFTSSIVKFFHVLKFNVTGTSTIALLLPYAYSIGLIVCGYTSNNLTAYVTLASSSPFASNWPN